MSMENFRQALLRYQAKPAFDVEIESQRQAAGHFLELLSTGTRSFDRDFFPAHFTSSVLITDATHSRVLLTFHKKLGKRLQLGGHIESDACPLIGAMREAREESGLQELTFLTVDEQELMDIDIHEIPARGNEPAHFHFDARYFLVAAHPEKYQISDESSDLRWIGLEELERYSLEPSLVRFAGKLTRMGEVANHFS